MSKFEMPCSSPLSPSMRGTNNCPPPTGVKGVGFCRKRCMCKSPKAQFYHEKRALVQNDALFF